MPTLQERLTQGADFLFGVELVSTRGTIREPRAAKTVAFAHELGGCAGIDWVSVTDNAGGNPMLAAPALGGLLRAAGREVVIHLSGKDFNRHGIESEAWRLASEGFRNLLVLSGVYPGKGIAGGGKPVFDVDSVGILDLLGRMNAGLDVTRPGGSPARLAPAEFFPGAVVTNFKLHENEVIPQLLKMERKLAAGARFLINQIGYDSRKCSELIAWLRRRGHGSVPLIGNVYVLNPGVARLFHARRIPGIMISDELAALCERQASSPDRGREFFLELAARQVAIFRGLGYRGAYLGGVHRVADIERIQALARSYGPNDWREFAKGIRFSRPGEFFAFAEDPATGLADEARLHPAYEMNQATRPRTPNVTYTYRFSKFVHGLMFTPDRGLWPLGERLCRGAKDPAQGPALLRVAERLGKSVMFDCQDCGDCSLPETAFLCPESACAKNQRNGPCGGTRDGRCEVEDFECIWSRAYDRLRHEGRALDLLAHTPVIQDQALRGSSSWANTWLGRDHLSRAPQPPVSPH
ncbi:MAG TPA: methylenetetrahydrofolate reductase C-terminal domain-containing protein [Opitutaceae bacterium]|nr:methylenetetrahydrofolate reductase C-terminal domain-containing protein [Opitutaceae bacterium]